LPGNDQAISKAFNDFGNEDCLFAFTSKRKIKSWFCEKNWRGIIEHVGFHVLVLEAMSYASEYQAFYYGKTAVELKRMKLSEVLGETYAN
jgi:hypothetical protein